MKAETIYLHHRRDGNITYLTKDESTFIENDQWDNDYAATFINFITLKKSK